MSTSSTEQVLNSKLRKLQEKAHILRLLSQEVSITYSQSHPDNICTDLNLFPKAILS